MTLDYMYFSCNMCEVFPIVGARYKCKVCVDYDFCENCFRTKKHRHPFNRIGEPGNNCMWNDYLLESQEFLWYALNGCKHRN